MSSLSTGLRALALSLLPLAAACAQISPLGMIAAASLNPLETDPAAIRAALEVPDTLRLSTGDAVLRLSFVDDEGTLRVDERVALSIVPGADGLRAGMDASLYTASVARSDRDRLAGAQAAIRAMRAAGVPGAGSLGVRIVGGCLRDAAPASLPVRSYLSLEGGAFVPLTRRADLFAALDPPDAAMLRARLVPCPQLP